MLLRESPGSSAQRTCSEMLLNVCAALDEAGIDWCVLHGYATYPEDVDPDDVDLMVRPEHFPEVPRVLARLPGVRLVHFRTHDGGTSTRYDVVSQTPEGIPVILGLDVASEIRDLGIRLLSPEEFLAGRRRFKERLWIPPPSIEFGHYLLKKLGKSAWFGRDALDGEHEACLSALFAEDPEGCRRQLARFFPKAEAALIAQAAHHRRWETVRSQLDTLRRAAARKTRLAHPQNLLRYWAGDVTRGIRRVLQPPGLMVAFLGLDGSGKSAVIARTMEALGIFFSSAKRYHLRPSLGAHGGDDTPGLEYEPARGPILSLAKLGLWWTDYWLGYALDIFPRLVRSTLVLFDRYYDDLLVDPQRYRFGGPLWLARMVARYLPRPELVILLDGPPELLRARKHGADFDDATRQRGAYVSLVRGLRGGHVVDASRPLDEVAAAVQQIIQRHLSARTAQRLRLTPPWTPSRSARS
ncbi:MAG TPA: thymidylate kinase-like protein [bacterium]|nr:thymidylate kinase-like protein [bacterium]